MVGRVWLAGVAMVALGIAGSASAAIVSGPSHNGFDTFTDTVSGLNWVRLDSFFDASHNQMATAVESAGFTVANRSEVAALLDTLTFDEDSSWNDYANVMGSAPNRLLIWGSYGPVDGDGNIGWAWSFQGDNLWSYADSSFAAADVPNGGSDIADMNIWAYYTDGVGPAVPEPAAWALMISGFGLTGLSLRRRRRPAVA